MNVAAQAAMMRTERTPRQVNSQRKKAASGRRFEIEDGRDSVILNSNIGRLKIAAATRDNCLWHPRGGCDVVCGRVDHLGDLPPVFEQSGEGLGRRRAVLCGLWD